MMWILKKLFKWLGIVILALLIVGNLAIVFTGRFYIYKGIASTYLRGHIRPNIYDLDVFENRKINANTPQPWVDYKSLGKLKFTDEERKRIEDLDPASFLVAWGDSIIFEEYWGEHDENRLGNSFSMSKSIVSLLIGIAVDEGKINSLHDPVADYIPEFKGEKENITIHNVLTMSSGLSWSENYSHPFNDVAELYYDTDAKDLVLNRRNIEEPPGKIWRYKSGDTQTLVYLLEKATGETLSDYASKKLWQPMGAESDAMWSLTDGQNSSEKGFCCFYSTSRDFVRLGKLVNNRGNWNGKQLISEEYMNEFVSLANLKQKTGRSNNCYGLQYWIYTGMPYEVTYFRGMSGQYIISIPEKDLIIVRTGNGTEDKYQITETEKDFALENHRTELPFYIQIGMRFYEEAKLK